MECKGGPWAGWAEYYAAWGRNSLSDLERSFPVDSLHLTHCLRLHEEHEGTAETHTWTCGGPQEVHADPCFVRSVSTGVGLRPV